MDSNPQVNGASRGFNTYRIVEKKRESEAITSFVLAASDGISSMPFKPGQFLAVRLPAGPGGAFVLRNYSLSGSPDDPHQLRISVKREAAPADKPELPSGLGSSFLHDRVQIGDLLEVAGPAGEFVLDENSERPVVLFSGGVGLTPMVSMLQRLSLHSRRRVYFIHACENGAVHAFRDEVLELATARSGITTHFCYRTPRGTDLSSLACDSQGLVTRETLQALLPLDDYDFYLCGPRPFMQANWRLLRGMGVSKSRINYEFFGPATILGEDEMATDSSQPQEHRMALKPRAPAGDAETGLTVQFLPSGTTATWEPSCHSLLDLAEKAGLTPPFNCRAGLCNSCMALLVEGSVEYFEAPLDPPQDGALLLCCSRPTTPITLDLGGC